MSVDTRTPRTPAGGPHGFLDDEPVLSTVKVPSDPAQVVVNHASFRVQLGGAARGTALAPSSLRPARAAVPPRVAPGAAGAAAPLAGGARRRRPPVVWTGRAGPADTGATRLLQSAVGGPDTAGATTQTLPRVQAAPVVGRPRDPQPPETLLGGVRRAEGAYDGPPPGIDRDTGTHRRVDGDHRAPRDAARPRGGDSVRHAYYPGRRMNLGVVLLPLRVFLGFISVYAGMGKLCDPVYFDGGRRGSMVTWLRSLDPWTIASPLHEFALAHPVGAGLTVAFLQVIVGVLTMCGLWQRLAAGIGALLSIALLVTVSWRTVAVYDAPDIIYLAAWSPLVIAGAPVYSMDARLAGEAWRTLGPRVPVAELRRRVLRRGTVLATVVAGLALLVGAVLGGAVRSSQTVTVPEPGEPPVNNLPGAPLPSDAPDRGANSGRGAGERTPDARRTPGPSASSAGTPGARRDGRTSPSDPSTVQAPQQSVPSGAPQPPAATSTGSTGATGAPGGSSTTGGGSSATGGGENGGTATGGDSGGSGGRSGGGALGGLLG
jgi:uncharacterized membrane protein YphA (DoxX/SURF4 family)